MKSSSKLLLAILALLLAFCLFYKFCCHHHTEPCACTPPNPTFTLTPTGVNIQSDNLGGPTAKIKVKVTGDGPGNTPVLINTVINAGDSIFVPVPSNIHQINIQMDYLDESLNICPVHVSLRTTFVIMDVIVELNNSIKKEDCPACAPSKTLSTFTDVATFPVPNSDTQLLSLKLDDTWVYLNYKIADNGKVVVDYCNGGLNAELSGNVIVFKDGGGQDIYHLTISKYQAGTDQFLKFLVDKISTDTSHTMQTCN